jgi:hypothetical protein
MPARPAPCVMLLEQVRQPRQVASGPAGILWEQETRSVVAQTFNHSLAVYAADLFAATILINVHPPPGRSTLTGAVGERTTHTATQYAQIIGGGRIVLAGPKAGDMHVARDGLVGLQFREVSWRTTQ